MSDLNPCRHCGYDGNEALWIERLADYRDTVVYGVKCSMCGTGFGVNVDFFAEPYEAVYEMWNKVNNKNPLESDELEP